MARGLICVVVRKEKREGPLGIERGKERFRVVLWTFYDF
jgi:hypothetical protein